MNPLVTKSALLSLLRQEVGDLRVQVITAESDLRQAGFDSLAWLELDALLEATLRIDLLHELAHPGPLSINRLYDSYISAQVDSTFAEVSSGNDA